MKKSIITVPLFLINIIMLSSCVGLSDRELEQHFKSHPPAVTMPYDNPRYLLHSVPDQLPFSLVLPPNGELLGTVESHGHESGSILLLVNQSAREIVEYYTGVLKDAAFTSASESRGYQVFFPSNGSGATFCGDQGVAVFLEIFEFEDGLKDVRLNYTTDKDVIKHTTCGQPVLAIEDFPFPNLAAPPNSSLVGGGGGGGGSGHGTRQGLEGYRAEIVIDSGDSLGSVYNHYVDLLAAEGWVLLNQSSTSEIVESNWDFGFYETRSWLAHLIATVGDAPNQYVVELRAISP